jgi:hypothetical protein
MPNKKVVRRGGVLDRKGRSDSASIGPGRSGKPLAKLWRIWCQGDEFYVAQRDSIQQAKLSFHSGGNWHYDVGHGRKTLGPGMPLSIPGWAVALQLKFLIHNEQVPASAVLTKVKKHSDIIIAETPPRSKLVLNVLTAPADAILSGLIPEEVDGVRCLALQRRSGGAIIVTANLFDLAAEDNALVAQMRGIKLTVEGLKKSARHPSAELMKVTAGPPVNLISVVPMLADNLDITYAPAESSNPRSSGQ